VPTIYFIKETRSFYYCWLSIQKGKWW